MISGNNHNEPQVYTLLFVLEPYMYRAVIVQGMHMVLYNNTPRIAHVAIRGAMYIIYQCKVHAAKILPFLLIVASEMAKEKASSYNWHLERSCTNDGKANAFCDCNIIALFYRTPTMHQVRLILRRPSFPWGVRMFPFGINARSNWEKRSKKYVLQNFQSMQSYVSACSL